MTVGHATPRTVDAAAVLSLLPNPPRVLALGEPTHGEDVLLDLRNKLFRQLVEQAGYRTIALESDCLLGMVVDDHVTGGPTTLAEAMTTGFSHDFGSSAANRELVRWMRAHNEGRPAADQVRFAGIDGPLETTGAASPRHALTALYDYLAARVGADLLPCTADTLDHLLGDDDRWPNQAAMMDPTQSVGQTPEATRLRLIADDLVAVLDAQLPHLAEVSSAAEWERVQLYARTATGLLGYHYWMADTSPGRLTRLLGVRGSMMAANLLALAERGPTLVYAHNGHLQRARSTMRLGGQDLAWWSSGAIVNVRLGAEYAVLATAVGTIEHRGVGRPPADTVEGRLDELGVDLGLIDPAEVATDTLVHRVSPWFGYAPLDPGHLASTDGIVYVRDVTASPRPA